MNLSNPIKALRSELGPLQTKRCVSPNTNGPIPSSILGKQNSTAQHYGPADPQVLPAWLVLLIALTIGLMPSLSFASGGGSGGGGTPAKVDSIKVSKCYYSAGTGQMLIKASSSDPTAILNAYRPDGTFQHEVQNGGGSRYGGTFVGWLASDPGSMTLRSSSGGSITVPTTPFQP